MIKTQVQIPDHLYREAKRIAGEYEMSFADVVRRGLERVVVSFPPRRSTEPWHLPTLDLGLTADPFADAEWRADLAVAPWYVHEPKPAARPRARKGGKR
jgi:hypothetical protein